MPPAPRALFVTGRFERELEAGWQVIVTEPSALKSPSEISEHEHPHFAAPVPGTTSLALDRTLEQPLEHDMRDAWYRLSLDATALAGLPTEAAPDARMLLVLDGLATQCEVYLDGELLASSQSMFVPLAIDLGDRLARRQDGSLELCLSFRALSPVLRQKRPRGRWPTRLVTEKHLRFVRTTLLGYMPGFWPTVRPVGPYRGVRLVREQGFSVRSVRIDPRLVGGTGVLEVALEVALLGVASAADRAVRLVLERDGVRVSEPLSIAQQGERIRVHGRLEIPDVTPWWPHTHGTPALYAARVELGEHVVDLGAIGFRSLERISADADDFGLRINGEEIFCRGANHTPLEPQSLHSSEAALRSHLEAVCAAGMNMLRVPGTTCYENTAFYRLCDELGILLFQDFMFANLDYPGDDPAFVENVTREAHALLDRLEGRPCLAALCGGSEVAQQAAMMGLPLATEMPLHTRVLAELCAARRPEVPYVPSSPSGGALPFHVGRGVSHYYGVGAYLRGFDDARASRPRFAAECLAFANVPCADTLRAWLGEHAAPQDERFRARIPRDLGADWDFLQVSEHYARLLSGLSAEQLAALAPPRYFALVRAATAEAMSRVASTLRGPSSGCRGALVWFLNDPWAAPGFGLIDHRGRPKAPYFALRRAWTRRAVCFSDEGLDGLVLHLHNDGSDRLTATLELTLHRVDGSVLERTERQVVLGSRTHEAHSVDALFGAFVDSSYAYRFGPPAHALVAAHLTSEQGTVLSRATFLPLGLGPFLTDADRIAAEVTATAAPATHPKTGTPGYAVSIRSARFAPYVEIEADGYVPSDDGFAVLPGKTHVLWLWPEAMGLRRSPARELPSATSRESGLAARMHVSFAGISIPVESLALATNEHA